MLRSISQRLTYANAMATLALFIALGGASYAATQLPAGSVGSAELTSRSVTRAKIDPALLKTLVGTFGTGGYANAAGTLFPAAITFSQPLAASLDAAHVIETLATPAHCPGAGRADPGYLCIYRPAFSNVTLAAGGPDDPVSLSLTGSGFGAGRYGTMVVYQSVTAGNAMAYGSWAVTAS